MRTDPLLLSRSLLAVACALLTSGCGGGSPPPATQAPATPAPPAPSTADGPATASPARRMPSEDVRRAWALDEHAPFVLYADVAGLLGTELGRSFVPAVIQLATSSMNEETTRCVRSAVAGLKELAMGAEGDDQGLVVARIDEASFDPAVCVAASGGRPAQLEGAREAYAIKKGYLVHEPGLLVAGSPDAVKRALAQRSQPARAFPEALSLGPDEYVAWSAQPGEGIRAHGTVLASSERFRLGVEADLPPQFAAKVERELRGVKAMGSFPGLEGAQKELVTKLLGAVELKRDGGHLVGAFDLREPPADQARDLGTLASLGILGVRKYLGTAKQAEAMNAVGQIARDYVAWWEKENAKPGARKKLVSLPAVPAAVPRGTKYQSSPADWKPWAAIRFEMDQPQYYQYEVRAAKNGESAEVLARGDLNGDGRTSLFTVRLHVDRAHGGVLVVEPGVAESDPEE